MSIDPHPCACMGEAPAVDAEHLREFLAEQRSALHREFSFAQQRLSFRHFEIMRGHGIPAAQLVADGRIGVVKANVERDDFWSPDEGGKSMIVTPVVEDGRTIDLVAFLLSDPDAWYLRTGDGWALEAVTTPGHTANHMAFAWTDRKILFVGDHVMGWSTSIVAPPDGSMIDYMASLEKLSQRGEQLYFSGHGPEIPEGPRFVRFLARHRRAREASILHRLAKGEADIPAMVRAIYIGLDPRLSGAAGYSVLAHLEDLVARGVVLTHGDPVIGGSYRLA